MRNRLLQLALISMLVAAGVFAVAVPSSAQEGGSTTTTQLDVGGGDAESTTTTQLEVGGADATTTTALQVGSQTPPNRVDAGGGGTATDRSVAPLALIALAGGLIVVTATAARRVRAGQR